ncbi:PIG-X-domain-containing protein [Xylona heveae TC161]|uniref:Protein PBN1 n=1 Tax=Xylona heveae (strain CBS 132557 / TC161) TaxID=1328760 RepID=A0A164ZJL4_XYLHT|nr:PIG-X-domain-containing protein [Xylona heveae TC161]KZF19180.1 PIG-X-domain-containing protein [Xylona heveae TC161]
MRQRITFLHKREDSFDPKQLHITPSDLTVNNLRAAKEHRWTLGYDELPAELLDVLKHSHELHIRWSSPEFYRSISPYISRVSPGLHVLYTPTSNLTEELCPALKRAFSSDLKCDSVENAFSNIPVLSDRFSSSPAKQYYHVLPSLDHFITYFQASLCPASDSACNEQAASLSSADYFDIDVDAISNTVILSAYWAHGPDTDGTWNTRIQTTHADDRVEVGILSNELPTEEEELSLSGFLIVIGQDSKPSPVLFSFPSRHHHVPSLPSSASVYHTSFLSPSGLHPTLHLSFPYSPLSHLSQLSSSSSSSSPPLSLPDPDSCSLNAYLTLPSYLFADQYQLSDSLFLQSKHIRSIRSLSGATDLEAPDWAVPQWGSSLLIELDPAHDTADVPLHLRYLKPVEGGKRTVDVPVPLVFWACPAQEGTKMAGNPFDRVKLGYDGLFGARTMFFHYTPAVNHSVADGVSIGSGDVSLDGHGDGLLTLDVPVLDTLSLTGVEWGTILVVFLGAAWIAWKLWGVVSRKSGESGADEGEKVRRKKEE